jgi:GTP cyclohydrolase IA
MIDVRTVQTVLEAYAGLRDDEHGSETPQRYLHAINELTLCKNCDGECIKWKDFTSQGDELIAVDSIPFTSLCNHHLLPFSGYAHIGYIPQNKIVGLSKLARVVHHFSRQLQLQERLTSDIADYLEGHLQPLGVAVILRAEHSCMAIRGVKVNGTITTSSAMRGAFDGRVNDPAVAGAAKGEFLQMIGLK